MTTIRRGYRERISRGDRIVNGIVVQVTGERIDTPAPSTIPEPGVHWRIETSRTQHTRGWGELDDAERAEVQAEHGDPALYVTMYFRREVVS